MTTFFFILKFIISIPILILLFSSYCWGEMVLPPYLYKNKFYKNLQNENQDVQKKWQEDGRRR